MSSTNDWHSIDQHGVCLPTIVSSTDLFDGELFGDELLDIYNSTVGDSHGSDDDCNGIPNLLIPDEAYICKSRDDEDPSHPGVQVAHVAAAIDDGLGAFRPSTSFNDLTTLLTASGESGASEQAVTVSTPTSPSTVPKVSKKRKSLSDSQTQAQAKKRGGARGGRKVSTKKQSSVTAPAMVTTNAVVAAAETVRSATKAKPDEENDDPDTPNPLDVHAVPAPTPTNLRITVQAPPIPIRDVTVDKALSPVTPESKNYSSDDEECDEEFTKMAQAAVSNLIATAGKEDGASNSSTDEKVDTSTEHIKALTGNNWVQACAGAAVGTPSLPTAINDPKAVNNRARRPNLTADERARQNRDRNREHARNTRLRKKAYVEELKRTLVELVAQRDSTEYEKRQSIQRELEQREVRFRVMEEFLKLRGRNEANAARWTAILEDGFTFTIPVTSYRKMVSSSRETTAAEQVLHGVADSISDSNLFSNFLQCLGNKGSEETVTFQYQMDRKNFFMDGCTGLVDWEGVTVGATKNGAESELSVKGSIRGTFSPASNKLLSAVLTFDTGVVVSQLRKLNANMFDEPTFASAQAAANQADAILDSLQMPMVSVPASVVVSSSSSTSDSSDKGDVSCDESVGESHEFASDTASATTNQMIA